VKLAIAWEINLLHPKRGSYTEIVTDRPPDSRQFRAALGSFVTGVTIVTTRAADGRPIGLTASSFNSLSLDPPMVLWALAKSARSLPAFAAAEHFAVHILAADQQDLASLFATSGADKFADLDVDSGPGRVPLLRGCSARFLCRTAHQYDGGDHTIFVGEVVGFDHFDRPALAFQDGAYANLVRQPALATLPADAVTGAEGSFSRDFLGYLLGSAHARLMARVRSELDRHQLAEEHYQLLMFLSNEDNLTLAELSGLAERHVTHGTLTSLAKRGLITWSGSDRPSARARLTAEGQRVAMELGVAHKAAEAHAERLLGANGAQTLKMMLRGILEAMPPAPPPARDGH
jgi:3-hydroxy-9,10-secoandrosta-1,3,5(10)-triene-9,17-dione monooxygenase reductase component